MVASVNSRLESNKEEEEEEEEEEGCQGETSPEKEDLVCRLSIKNSPSLWFMV